MEAFTILAVLGAFLWLVVPRPGDQQVGQPMCQDHRGPSVNDGDHPVIHLPLDLLALNDSDDIVASQLDWEPFALPDESVIANCDYAWPYPGNEPHAHEPTIDCDLREHDAVYVNPTTGYVICTDSPAGIDTGGNPSGFSFDETPEGHCSSGSGFEPGWQDDSISGYDSHNWS